MRLPGFTGQHASGDKDVDVDDPAETVWTSEDTDVPAEVRQAVETAKAMTEGR